GWGAFYLVEKEARWDAATNTAFPRGKYVAFNPARSSIENTLLPTVMRTLGGSMEIAESWIRRKVNQWQTTLDSGSVLMLSGLGSFRKNGMFQPERENQFDANSFGFTAVMMHRISEPSALESKVVASLKMVAEQRENGLSSWRKAAVAAAITALISLGIYQSDITPQAMAGWFTPTPAAQEALDNFESINSEAVAPSESVTPIDATNVEENQVSMTPSKAASKKYYIVVGSFKMESNALTLAEELQAEGHEVKVLPGSLMKVGLGGFESRDQAKSALAGIKAEVNSYAWIYAY
ncbi:MAG: SPOR domain-containing protein, partial [Schleiferiaceae bacterium]|nr:SPOR domain-containing protein [Schleiferiaceae bacterium]